MNERKIDRKDAAQGVFTNYSCVFEQDLTPSRTIVRQAQAQAPGQIQIHTRKMHIQSIPMWEGTMNNYAYLVVDEKSRDAVIIDPANPEE